MISPGKLSLNDYTQELCLSHPFSGLAFDPEYYIFNFIQFPCKYHVLGLIDIEW